MSSVLTELFPTHSVKSYHFSETGLINILCNELDLARKNISVNCKDTLSTDEIHFSALLAGYEVDASTIEEIINSKTIDFTSNVKVQLLISGYIDAIKLAKLYNWNIDTKEKMHELWKVLTAGCCNNIQAAGEIWRIENLDNPFRGNDVSEIDSLMDSFIEEYNKEPTRNVFLSATYLCTMFSRISPFCDGNARFARLLAVCYLMKNGVNEILSLNLSKSIYDNRKEYLTTLCTTPTSMYDCTLHIECVLNTILNAYNKLYTK